MTWPTFTSYEAKVYEFAALGLAESAAFRDLVGVATAVLARSRIVIFDGGAVPEPEEAEDPIPNIYAGDGTRFRIDAAHAVLWCDAFPASDPATGYTARSWQMRIELLMPPVANDNPPQRYIRMLNTAGTIRDQLNTWYRARALGSVSLDPKPLADSTGWLPRHTIAQLTISGRTP